ncbi:MAG: hypothetical protein RLN70_02960, partial [Rhodospirillaceae bacterium]
GEIQTPIIPGKLSAIASVSASSSKYDWRGTFDNYTYSALLNWTPSDSVDAVAFARGQYGRDGEAQPLLFTAGAFTPPRYDRSVYFGQEWASRNRDVDAFGGVVNAVPADGWRIRAGLFRSTNVLTTEYIMFVRNTQPDGSGELEILKSQPQFSGST